MLVLEAKLRGENEQYRALDEALRTARFIRNSCIRYWMDNKGLNKYDLSKYCAVLAQEFEWAGKLNSMARQAHAERAWTAISRFFDNCKKQVPGLKGFPKFRKHQTNLSVEYKTTGWKLSDDRLSITFKDGFEAGSFRMWGTRDLHYYQIEQIKRVRVVRRADGYYVQFCVDVERSVDHKYQNRVVGIDVGLNHFYTDSDGNTVEKPRYLRKSERSLLRSQRRLSRKKKGSKNRAKARNKVGRKHLKVSRQRKDFALKIARCVVESSDLVAYEDLKVRNMVKNHHLAKSISDASWSQFREWLEYFGRVFGVGTIAVPPHYTSQNCSGCGAIVKKSLSTRTHTCSCGTTLDRDHNAALNILRIGLSTVGHTGINAFGENNLCVGGETPPSKLARRKRKPK
jgi:putative transposase